MNLETDKEFVYAAYGSNLNLEQMSVRCPGYKQLAKGILHDYQLVFGREGYLDVRPNPGHKVQIGLFTVTKEHIRSLDEYERYPELYDRFEVPVETQDQGTIQALIYVMKPYPRMEKPSKTYWQAIQKGFEDFGFDTKDLDDALALVEEES